MNAEKISFLRLLNYYIIMGRGDKKTKKGKIFQGSFGKSRPHKTKKKNAKKG
jgi:30S ribosomal protein S31